MDRARMRGKRMQTEKGNESECERAFIRISLLISSSPLFGALLCALLSIARLLLSLFIFAGC